jgi:serine protease AprX
MNFEEDVMRKRFFSRLFGSLIVSLLMGASAWAATLGPALAEKIRTAPDAAEVGVVIVAFDTSAGLNNSHLDLLRGVGITRGLTLNRLGMVALPATAGQIRALAASPAVRSIWPNERLFYYMQESRVLAGVDRLRTDAAFTRANGGLPVSGRGDFAVVVNDSGIDATHPDLKYGTKVVQNVQILTDTDTLAGFTPLLAVEGLPNTDTHVGHGTHCAGILAGTGQQSGGRYAGVAPGAKIIGTGSGAGLFILNGLGGFEWSLANQFQYNIRVISNSWGGGGAFNPDNPINIASRAAYERNIVVLFAAGNSGPGPDTHNPYAKAPWVISVGAGTKEGGLASFSSRGTPREERLADADPHNDFDAPTIVAPGTGREFASNAGKFTAAMIATRSLTNVVSNGLTDDTEIPVAYLPYYTQISGTSMATPFVAGVVALMLDADPTLSADEIKQIITETASRMPGYADFEVGAGYVNAYAAVDKVFNRSRGYRTPAAPDFNTELAVNYDPEATNFQINYMPQEPGPTSGNTFRFTVAPGKGLLNVRIDFGTNAVTDEAGNSLGLQLYPPGCLELACGYSSGLTLPALDSPRRQIIIRDPAPGQWVAEIRGLRGLTLSAGGVSTPLLPFGVAVPERVDGVIKTAVITMEEPSDIAGRADESQIKGVLRNRMMDTFADNTFRPDEAVTRGDFARFLSLNTPLRQSLGATAKFTDVAGSLAPIAEAVTANGSTLRDWNFAPLGMMSFSNSLFNPNAQISRLDLAVALVRALGLDAEAKAKANTSVTYQGQVVTDNAAIPGALRGYVQFAIDKGLLEVYPAEVRQTGPGQFMVIPGPRVEPDAAVTRAALAAKATEFARRFAAGN